MDWVREPTFEPNLLCVSALRFHQDPRTVSVLYHLTPVVSLPTVLRRWFWSCSYFVLLRGVSFWVVPFSLSSCFFQYYFNRIITRITALGEVKMYYSRVLVCYFYMRNIFFLFFLISSIFRNCLPILHWQIDTDTQIKPNLVCSLLPKNVAIILVYWHTLQERCCRFRALRVTLHR